MLLWIEGAPKLEEDLDGTVCNFIDKSTSCSKSTRNSELDGLVSRQEHKH